MPQSGATNAGRQAFERWASSKLVALPAFNDDMPDETLAGIDAIIGSARLVGLSEAVHCAAEPLLMRNHLFKYLVRKHGFTAIAIESGLVESRLAHDYVRNGQGALSDVVAKGLTWGFQHAPQNRDLIAWMRAYNEQPSAGRPISFYGFDMAGSPGGEGPAGADVALKQSLAFLDRIDIDASQAFRTRVGVRLHAVQFSLMEPAPQSGYGSLSLEDRAILHTVIEDLIARFDDRRRDYIRRSSAEDFDWARQCALASLQLDDWLAHIPVGWRPLAGRPTTATASIGFLGAANDVRDAAQADNIDWILRREGPNARLLIFASQYHLSATPVASRFWADSTFGRRSVVAGVHLRQRYGADYVSIGNLIGGGEAACGRYRSRFDRAPDWSLDGALASLGVANFFLDLRTAPALPSQWLQGDHDLALGGVAVMRLAPAEANDALVYIDTVTPACCEDEAANV